MPRPRRKSHSRASKIWSVNDSAHVNVLNTARKRLVTYTWTTFYVKPHEYFAKKLVEYTGVKAQNSFGEPITFGILHEGIITLVNQHVVPNQDTTAFVSTTIIPSERILPHVDQKTFESDLLNYIDLSKEWETVKSFMLGLALFPFTVKAVEKGLGKRITSPLNLALQSIEKYSDRKEWTPLTQQVMTEYFEDNSWIIDKLADRILHNTLLQGFLE